MVCVAGSGQADHVHRLVGVTRLSDNAGSVAGGPAHKPGNRTGAYHPATRSAVKGCKRTARWTGMLGSALEEWGMILLMSLLAGITLWRLRRETM